ncbi:MAG: DUF4115 domain-containing protein [Chloroflexi bacterium]|nr:DUF4115 domain-containing protein [Chloroflexota bacterium]
MHCLTSYCDAGEHHLLSTVGQQLREAREARGISLEELSRETRIRLAYLEALERDEYERLPAIVYARGFLRTCASYLGLEPEVLLRQFEMDYRPISPQRPQSPQEVPVTVWHGPSPRAMTGAVAIVVIVLVIAFLFRQYSLFVAESASGLASASTTSSTLSFTTSVPVIPTVTPLPTQVPTSLPVTSQTHSVTTSITSGTTAVSATATRTPTPSAPLTLSLHFLRTCWLRVIVDGKMVFEGTLQPGSTRTWTAQQFITVRLGNAGGVDVVFNGKDEGIAGHPGEVVDRTFRLG